MPLRLKILRLLLLPRLNIFSSNSPFTKIILYSLKKINHQLNKVITISKFIKNLIDFQNKIVYNIKYRQGYKHGIHCENINKIPYGLYGC